jgi:hypothetical protein
MEKDAQNSSENNKRLWRSPQFHINLTTMSTPSPVNSYSSSVPKEIQDLLQGYGYAPHVKTPTPPETPNTTMSTSTGPEIIQELLPLEAEAPPSTQTRQGRAQLRNILMKD